MPHHLRSVLEQGKAVDGPAQRAPARRVGFVATYDTVRELNAIGRRSWSLPSPMPPVRPDQRGQRRGRLFDAVVAWAAG